MRNSYWFLLLIFIVVASCSSENEETEAISTNIFAEYFYPFDTIPKVYVYRNVANGLEEQFHRILSLNDEEGKHVVVEVYQEDGRITEAYNYNFDSLQLMDYMVVNRKQVKEKTELFKTRLIPDDKKSSSSFAARFSGISDSTLFLREIDRNFEKETHFKVLGKDQKGVQFKSNVRLTLFNPFTKMEDVREGKEISCFAEGYGLVEWHSVDKSVHFRLEKIMTQNEFVNLISK